MNGADPAPARSRRTASTRYEEALRLGLSGEHLRRCLCQYGSTLRWLGRLDESLQVLNGAARDLPGSDSVRVFRALTLNELGHHDAAVAELLTVATDHADTTDLGRYAAGLTGLAARYRDGRHADD